MAFQILVNMIIAVIWMFLWNSFTMVDFVIGYIVGLLQLYILRRFMHYDFYFRRVIASIKLILLFTRELVMANIDMVKIVLRPKMDITPGIIAVPTQLRSEWEVTLLAVLISLTPGTLSMGFSDDSRTLYVHSVHVPDKEQMIQTIQNTFEKSILEVTH